MGWRFNPPPNWPPSPPGWVPPPGWQPDPSWGPAPIGHVFWVEDLADAARAIGHETALNLQGSAPNSNGGDAVSLGNGLAVTALVASGASLLFSWVPIINNVVFFGALLGLIMAICALVITWSARGYGRVMAFAAILVSVLATAVVLFSQVFYASLFV